MQVKQEDDTSSKINLDVLSIVVLDRSNAMLGPSPYTTNNFQPTITNAIRQWASEKLVAVGTTGQAIFVIKDASLKSEAIPYHDSWFTREQTSKYVGHAEIELDVTGHEGHGMVTTAATQFETLPETPSSIERQNAYTKLLNGLMHDLGNNVRGGIHDHINNFVITAPVIP